MNWRDGLALVFVVLLVAILLTSFNAMSPKEQEQLIWFFILTG
jgi:hypothetical protein